MSHVVSVFILAVGSLLSWLGQPALTPLTLYEQRVNCGGVAYTDGAGLVWEADRAWDGVFGYSGGVAKASSKAVNNTGDDPLYQRWRDNPGEYRFAAPNGVYEVLLRFAEFEVTNATSRVFSITIEGQEVESALSIYGEVGRFAALDKVYQTTVADGVLTIGFRKSGGSKSPVVSAIAVRQLTDCPDCGTQTPAPSPTTTATAPATPVTTPTWPPTTTPTPEATATPTTMPVISERVNSGGFTYTDITGQAWSQDRAFSVDGWGYTGGVAKSTISAVAGTNDDPLYQKWRESPGTYRFTAPNGDYEVTLKFAEFEVSKSSDRLMQIAIEGVVVEDQLSIYGMVGKATALDKVYRATVRDGVLDITFSKNGGKKNPVVSAVAIVALALDVTPTPSATPTPTSTLAPTSTPPSTSAPTSTPTSTLAPTSTPTSTSAPTPTPTSTSAPTSTPTSTLAPTPTPTSTLAPTPTPTATYLAGDLGWVYIYGRVTNTAGAPIAGATVTCDHFSYVPRTLCAGSRTTDSQGWFNFGNVFLHDTDNIVMTASAADYQPQTLTRSGLNTWYNPQFNFTLTP